MGAFWKPHRLVMLALAVALVAYCALNLRWDWLGQQKYQIALLQGIWRSIWLTVVTMAIGMVLAIPIG